MIPILYDSTETAFTSNGLGRLSDAIRCEVTEVRNGIFELELDYPIDGTHYDDITENCWISATHDEQGDRQPFRVYGHSATIDGITTFYAHHVSYLLSNVILKPFTATSCADALAKFETEVLTAQPFTFWTDKATGGTFTIDVPEPAKKMLGGTQGSILDVFGGGEYEFDGYTVKLYQNRGSDNGVTIRYGKNLTDLKDDYDAMDLYDAVIPYWKGTDGTVVYGAKVIGNGSGSRCVTMDLSQEFETAPTAQQLQTRAASFLASNQPWIPKRNIKVSFAALWQTEEYKDIAPLERVRLCDTVTVIYTELGVKASAKVIKTVYNTLLDRYDSIELGEAKTSFAQTITASVEEVIAQVPTTSMMERAINKATELLRGGTGGYVVINTNADGTPNEILIMDTPDIATAVNVVRMNRNGIGFSNTGYSGTYTTAWTIDGAFTADVITAGTMLFNRLKGGTLELGGADNGNGVIVVKDATDAEIGRWDKDGLSAVGDFTLEKKGTNYAYTSSIANFVGLSDSHRTYNATGLKTAYEKISTGEELGVIASGICPYITPTDIWPIFYLSAVRRWYTSTSITYGIPEEYRVSRYIDNADSATVRKTVEHFAYYEEACQRYIRDSSLGRAVNYKIGVDPNGFACFRIDAQNSSGGTYPSYMPPTANETSGALALAATSAGVYRLFVDGNKVAYDSSSSRRYKHDITDQIDADLEAHKLYGLRMVQFVFNDDHAPQYRDMRGKTVPGFIAEEVEEVYPAATIHDEDGRVESWDERRIIPGMLKLIQEQKEQIDALTKRIEVLEELLGVAE